MADLSQLTKTEAVQKLERLRNSMAKYREEAKKAGQLGVRVAAGAGGGVASGVLQHYRPELWEGSGMPTDAAASLLVGGAAFFADDETTSDVLVNLAVGLGAPALSRMTERMLREREQQR